MSTSYEMVFKKFIKKLKNDTQFFNYKNVPEDEINRMVEDHLITLLNTAIDKLYSFGLPDFDFYDKDDKAQLFNGNLVVQEIGLLADIMYFAYAEEDRNKFKALGTVFRTSEINVFSPANERNSYMNMIETEEVRVNNLISNYYSRDRHTWKEKSIYGGI